MIPVELSQGPPMINHNYLTKYKTLCYHFERPSLEHISTPLRAVPTINLKHVKPPCCG